MTEKIEDGKLKPQCGRRGSVLRNSAALLALSIFVGPLLPQAALADCGSGVTFTCTGNDTDGKTVNITTSSGTGTMVAGPPAATISNASGSVPLTVNFLNFVGGQSFTFTAPSANNEIQSTNANAFQINVSGSKNSTATIDYSGTLDALNGNALNYSASVSTGGTATADITFQEGSLVTASGTSDLLGVPTAGGGVVMTDINPLGSNAWTVTNHGTFLTRNDAISMYSTDNGTYVINSDGTLGTSLNPLGGSGAVIVASSASADGTVNNNGGEIWAAGGGGPGGVFGGIAVVVGGNAVVDSVDGDVHTVDGPGVLASGGKSATVDTQDGLVESTNGPGIIAATLGTGNTVVDSGEVNAGSGAFAGLSLPAGPLTVSASGGVIGYASNGNATVNTHGNISVATGGQFGAAAISQNGSATLDLNGVTIDPPLFGGTAIVLGGSGDATITTDGANVSADQIGLLGLNTGSGKIIIDNNLDGKVNSAGAGIVALKLGAGDSAGGESVQITNTGSVTGANGPGVGVIALDTTSTYVNNVYIQNTGDALIRGSGTGLLSPGIGVIADGKVTITNDENSTIDTTAGNTGLVLGIGAGGNISITNDHASDILGRALIGSTSGSVTITNDHGSTWTSEGVSVIGALGSGQSVTLDNKGGSNVTVTDGLLAMAANQDVLINNYTNPWAYPPESRSAISFEGSSANLMIAGRDAIITNDGSDFTMDSIGPGAGGNLMFAGRDAKILNMNGATFSMNNLLNGNYMNAENDAVIENTNGSTFTMTGINGNVMVADNDATITNELGSTFELEGLNGALMIADAGSSSDPSDGVGDAKIQNLTGSTITFRGLTLAGMTAAGEASITNDDTSSLNFFGLNLFNFSAKTTYLQNDGTTNVDGVTVFNGLQNLNNHGLINMVDDATDDAIYQNDGNYNAGSDWWIDAELTPGGTADFMYVGGNVTGVTHLGVNDTDTGPGQYDPDGILFAVVSGTTDPSNFTTDGGIDKGLYRYDAYLRPNDPEVGGDNGWYLASTLDQEAYEFPVMMYAAQSLWNASTGTWLDRTADLRTALGDGAVDPSCAKDCMPEQGKVTPGVWMKALAGTQSRDDHNTSAPPNGFDGPRYGYDNSFYQNYWGFLIGADTGQQWTTDSGRNAAWLVGIMGGYLGSRLNFDNSNTDVDYEAFTAGVYTTYMNGGFFVDGTFKADIGTMDYSSNLGGNFSDDTSSDFTSLGGIVDMGYRMDVGTGVFFEPLATLSYVNTSIDDMDVLGTNVSYDDGESLQGRLGARLGASIDGQSMKSELFVEASVWNEFLGYYDAHLGSNGYDVKTNFDAGGVYGEVALGANVFSLDSNWNGFLAGAVQFGDDDFLGYSGNVGMRYSW